MTYINWYSAGRLVTGRVIRNGVFWILFTFYHYSGKALSTEYYFILMGILLVSYGIPCYFNNLWLMPKFLQRRRYLYYFLVFFVLLAVTTVVSYYVTIWINGLYPDINYMGNLKNVSLPYHVFPSMLMFTIFAAAKFTSDAFINQRRVEQLETQRLESELSSLKSQINPHFLFNALNTIYGYSRLHIANTPDTILKLSEILRYVLYESNVGFISVQKELSFIQRYIEFANLRQRKGTQIHLTIEAGTLQSPLIAPLLMLPFVENAIKHGLDSRIEGAFVEADITVDRNKLRFRCSNNYKTPSKKQDTRQGIGLVNVKRRLELVYPGRHTLDVVDEKGIFSVHLELALHETDLHYNR